jgi:hypothetical protein
MRTAKPITPDRPIGTQQISKIANVSPRTVARWVDRRLLPGYVVPGSTHRRCMPRDLLAFLQQANMPIPPELAAVAESSDSLV